MSDPDPPPASALLRSRHLKLIAIALGSAILVAAGAAPAADFDPRQHRNFSGPPSEVMVLGSPHLRTLPDGFDPGNLAPVLDRLATWHPAIIAVEALSGPQCDFLRRFAAAYPGAAATYCWDPAPAQAATGLDVPAATVEIAKRLKDWPAQPTAAQRRSLAAVFLAGGETTSAEVQWLRLPEAERQAADGLDAALVERLETARTRHDESVQIAARLAARLGLERVYAVDDHSADASVDDGDDAAFGAAIQRAWTNPANTVREKADHAVEAGYASAPGVLEIYRHANAASQAGLIFDSDFGAALLDPSPEHYGRIYAATWEARNLAMVTRLRAAMAAQPGQRTLMVVGASHKPYFEAYLRMLHDVKVAASARLLGAPATVSRSGS